ncbi:MAG: hypothetical protein KC492_31505 [Myxococcales bacterium]|nr:hypothetical protein [Myxococcales bacterium]
MTCGLLVIGCGGLTGGDGGAPGSSTAPEGTYFSYQRVAHSLQPADGVLLLCVPPQVVGADCAVVEAKSSVGACDCAAPQRPASDAARAAATGELCDAPGRSACADLCLCERKLAGDAFALSERCPAVLPYAFAIAEGTQSMWLSCSAQQDVSYSASAVPRAVGEACTPSVESDPQVSFIDELSVLDVGSPQCESGLCLAYEFQGRTDCPYGTLEGDCSGQGGPSATGAVTAQRIGRRAQEGVTCSCRCDGPNPCACPSGMVCESLFGGLGEASAARGSYCVFPPGGLSANCNQALADCED